LLTARGWWVLLAGGVVTLLGVVVVAGWTASVAVFGLALLGLFAVEWTVFAYRRHAIVDNLDVSRVLIQGRRVVPVAWANRPCRVRVTVHNASRVRLPFVVFDDRPPPGLRPISGSPQVAVALGPGESTTLEYELDPQRPGLMRFEGVTVRLADLCGWFYHRRFLRAPAEFLVLSPLQGLEGKRRGAKRSNTLPPPGIHRLRRAGSGDELLDLRDYVAGDPPKMIAWKASARRDRLITKEFENDVPVRCAVFLDASQGVRVPVAGQKPVEQLAGIGAALSQAAVKNRDLVGLTVFDDAAAKVTPAKRTSPHVIRLLRSYAESAALLPDKPQTNLDVLTAAALPLANDIYPDLMTKEVNTRPWRLYWRPLLDAKWGWLAYLLWLLPVCCLLPPVLNQVMRFVLSFGLAGLGLFLLTLWILTLAVQLFWLVWWGHGLRGFLPSVRRAVRRRKQLGLVYATLDGTGPLAVERAIHDDGYFRDRTNRFLAEHRVPLPVHLLDHHGTFRFPGDAKASVLSDALIRSVGRARDNELFVVLADLMHLGPARSKVLRSIRLATARHHRVLVVVPWPEGIPNPPPPGAPPPRISPDDGPPAIVSLVERAVLAAYHRAFADLRAELTRAGASLVRVDHDEAVRLVLEKLDRLRGVRARR
jgi:uncharacterized protein (DUF58 family)